MTTPDFKAAQEGFDYLMEVGPNGARTDPREVGLWVYQNEPALRTALDFMAKMQEVPEITPWSLHLFTLC